MSDLLQVLQGDALAVLRTLPDQSVHCCVTSPPYWGLRNYGVEGQIGLEKTPEEYVAKMVALFGEVRRVLRDDGSLWLNLGDSFNAGRNGGHAGGKASGFQQVDERYQNRSGANVTGLKPKDLVGIPWLTAFALRQDGWYLRSEITWCKKVPMPESVLDRPTSATEKIFLLTKSARYWYDAEAVRNPPSESFLNDSRWKTGPTPENEKNGYADAGAQNPKQVHRIFNKARGHAQPHEGLLEKWDAIPRDHANAYGSNMRNYWVLGPEPFKDAHFATFPTEVPRKCILAGCPTGGTVLDPFAGSGTTGQVALELGRKAVLIELNPAYIELIHQRTNVTPGFSNLHSQPPDGTPAEPVPPKTNQ